MAVKWFQAADDDSAYEDRPIPPRPQPLTEASDGPSIRISFTLPDFSWSIWDPLAEKSALFAQDARRYVDRKSDAVYRGVFRSYYTTYRDLPREVLEGYFGWRTRLRQGRFDYAPLSFVFLYVYEILGLYGFSDPREGFGMLEQIYAHYEDFALRSHLLRWGRDFAIYYDLGAEYLSRVFAEELEADRFRTVLRRPEQSDPRTVFEAMQRISGWTEKRSVCLRDHGTEAAEVMGRAYTALCEHRRTHGNPRFAEMFSGVRSSRRYEMFRGAVFHEQAPHPDCRVEIDGARAYVCKEGQWRCSVLGGNRPLQTLRPMTELMREVDRLLREAAGWGRPLKPGALDAETMDVLRRVVADWDGQRREALRPKVEVRFDLLAGIRSDAAHTEARLLEGQEEEDELPPEPEAPQIPAPSEEESAPPAGLTADELQFLTLLLTGGDWKGFCTGQRLLPALLADTINEKLMETFGDTVIVGDDTAPAVLEDYAEELRDLLLPDD